MPSSVAQQGGPVVIPSAVHLGRVAGVTLLLILVGGVGAAGAQEVSGALEGRVLGPGRRPLASVELRANGPNLQGERSSATDERGYFRILGLPVGRYTVSIRRIGYQPVRYESVSVYLGRTASLGDTQLREQAEELSEIVVSGERALIDPTSTTTGANLTRESFEALPIERDYRSIATLAPQANASFLGDAVNIAGSTGPENIYFIDGVNVTDPWLVRTGTSLPYNFIREVEVKTGGYEAEYGRALGGIVNVITHTGGNAISGQVFGYYTGDFLAGRTRLGAADANVDAFSRYDVGFGIGGPIKRDRLWYFTAYNASFDRQDLVIPGVPTQHDRRTQHLFAGKLTWQPGPRTELLVTAFGDPGTRQRVGPGDVFLGSPVALVNPDPLLGEIRDGGLTVALRGRHLASETWLMDFSVAHYTRRFDNHPATARGRRDTLFIDNGSGGIWSGGYGWNIRERLARSAASLSLTGLVGAHSLKAGLQYEDNSQDELYEVNGLTRYGDSSYLAVQGYWDGAYHNRVPSVFVQDTWLITDRVRLNLGMRWDGQYLVASDARVAQAITDQWQPRVGFVYQPGLLGTQRVFGSFGRFYEQLPLAIASLRYTNSTLLLMFYDHDPRIDPSGANTADYSNRIIPWLRDLEGQYFDEFNLGYERTFGRAFRLGLRGTYRTLRQVIDDTFLPDSGRFVVGNPGRGLLSGLPKAKRDYQAFEITAERSGPGPLTLLASYVLSRNYGNYAGLFNSESGTDIPNQSWPDYPDQFPNSTGLLPNDRSHTLKCFIAYRFQFGLTTGGSFAWSTGTPLNEFAGAPGQQDYRFLRPRGSAGRTPSIWDISFRFSKELPSPVRRGARAKAVLDLFHVASPRRPVSVDQIHFFGVDTTGTPINPNPNYLRATRHQPPMSARIGVVLDF